MNPDSLRENLAMAVAVAPSIGDVALLRTWVGVGNGTPDHGPILGEVPHRPGVFVGFYPYMGFTASPLMGAHRWPGLATGHAVGEVDLAPLRSSCASAVGCLRPRQPSGSAQECGDVADRHRLDWRLGRETRALSHRVPADCARCIAVRTGPQ